MERFNFPFGAVFPYGGAKIVERVFKVQGNYHFAVALKIRDA